MPESKHARKPVDPGIWVVIPAYNESKVIGSVLESFQRLDYHIVVVDDGSRDQTSQIAGAFPIDLLRHKINLGQGAALKTGIAYALTHACQYIVTFDADGQHTSDDISRLLAPVQRGTVDVALGSRFILGATSEGINARRKTALRLAIFFTRLSTRLDVTDTHNGLRAFTRLAAERIRISQNGMAHASEILSEIARYKLRYCEVPVRIRYTPYSIKKGQSLLNSINILLDLLVRREK